MKNVSIAFIFVSSKTSLHFYSSIPTANAIMPVNLMTAFVGNCMFKTFVLILHHLLWFFSFYHILFEDSYTGNSYHEEKKICPIKQLYWDGYAVDFFKKYIIVLGIGQLLTQRSITINSLRISSCVWLFLLYFFNIICSTASSPALY